MKLRRTPRKILFLFVLSVFFSGSAQGAEPVRRVQEELRRRNLFFGDVDGRSGPELAAALRLYQSHKGFEPTGKVDRVTARSLGIDLEPSGGTSEAVATRVEWPEVPVLKSDAARALPAAKQAELEKAALANLDPAPAPEIPAESPAGAPDLDPAAFTGLVERYLAASERDDLESQLRYYAYPVDYFDHGLVNQKFVARDNANYMRRWPERHYALLGPVKTMAGPNESETVVVFSIAFEVRNQKHQASGKTRNFWTLRPEGTDWKIVAIKEEHLRE